MTQILIIEDENQIQEMLQEILELEGYETLVADNGEIGVQLAKAERPDLIFCDLMMPVLDGYGVLMELQEDPSTKSSPVIVLSALSDQDSVRTAVEWLGAVDYLTKPIMRDQLLKSINQALDFSET